MAVQQIMRVNEGPTVVTVHATESSATKVSVKGLTSGTLHITDSAASVTAVDVYVYVSTTSMGTYRPLYDRYNAIVSLSSVDGDRAYDIPGEAFGSPYIKFVAASGSSFSGTVTLKA